MFKDTKTYVKPLAELLPKVAKEILCSSYDGGDPEDLVDGGTEEW